MALPVKCSRCTLPIFVEEPSDSAAVIYVCKACFIRHRREGGK